MNDFMLRTMAHILICDLFYTQFEYLIFTFSSVYPRTTTAISLNNIKLTLLKMRWGLKKRISFKCLHLLLLTINLEVTCWRTGTITMAVVPQINLRVAAAIQVSQEVNGPKAVKILNSAQLLHHIAIKRDKDRIYVWVPVVHSHWNMCGRPLIACPMEVTMMTLWGTCFRVVLSMILTEVVWHPIWVPLPLAVFNNSHNNRMRPNSSQQFILVIRLCKCPLCNNKMFCAQDSINNK